MNLDWKHYESAARSAAAEGIVLLENNGALPLDKAESLAVFGRMAEHYYKSGTGSGGMVNVDRVYSIVDGLLECGISLNEELRAAYADWEKENPLDPGIGWGGEPWSQREMPLSDELAARAAEKSPAALCIIGRTAGEEQDATDTEGSYRLTSTELEMLKTVRAHFKKMTVALNVGNIIDMSFVELVKPDAVLYAWQGGMMGGLGTADVLVGNTSPNGKLTDTIAKSVSDYPSAEHFGNTVREYYCEDIYVGYRYFETFAPEKVLYPFGFGVSYTKFELGVDTKQSAENIVFEISVKNIGENSGKEVAQVYFEAPQGKLGQPVRQLAAFAKTRELAPGETQILKLTITLDELASFDDSGVTGNRNCFVREAGEYKFYVGNDARSAREVFSFTQGETFVTKKLSEALAPVLEFERIKPVLDGGKLVERLEGVPVSTIDMDRRRAENLPEEIPQTEDKGIKLADVKSGKRTMNEFIAQLSDEDLSCIIRGEGMGSPQVTPGTASAFGGVTPRLKKFGIPAGCCDDGPSGMRLDCGTKAFSLPNGTMLACTFNTELVEELYTLAGIEIAANNVECLLGPGMNIHRHPLNGRNFEYFSEDPLVTGKMAAAILKGLHKSKVTGTIKHFAGNNQETGRHTIDSVISQRALREIYLKGFEIAVKEGNASTIMTTYGSLNGVWTAGNYDLCTTILRGEWGFDGFVMTDWWSAINERGKDPTLNNFAAMARAQNDVYMVCADSSKNTIGDNTLSSLEAETLTRGELRRNAKNICRMLMNTRAMDRLLGIAEPIEIVNRPYETDSFTAEDVEFIPTKNGELTIPLDGVSAEKGGSFVFALDVDRFGLYEVTLAAIPDPALSETAQIPVTLFTTGIPSAVFTFNGGIGKSGEVKEITKPKKVFSRFVACRLYFGGSGLTLKEIRFRLVDENAERGN
ncbi:MAG: glycoside hydrolase family 3 C-terminal domain-containing protein [Oscillospiraceae bacterium]|nr:glycoside hydrolase family 3 C-terminal domain-containing protein [Oscillospiraceae bacterium]